MTTDGPGLDAENGQGPRTPTRRRLLTLLALSTVPTVSVNAGVSDPDPPHDPIPRLFVQFEDIVAAHERALIRIDRLEKLLVARLGYPRVRLPTALGHPAIYAAEPSSIDRHGLSAKATRCLKRDLRRREKMWAITAVDVGLADAVHHEEIMARAVRTIGSLLLATPATTLSGIHLKLIVLLALQQPGQRDAHTSPWRELRLILEDVITC